MMGVEIEVLSGEGCFRYTNNPNPCSARVINTSWKNNLLFCSFSIVNSIDGLIQFTLVFDRLLDEAKE